MAIDTFPQPVVTSDVNTDKNEHAVFVGSCDGVVVLPASELPNYYDGYRTVMLLAILIAIPMLGIFAV